MAFSVNCKDFCRELFLSSSLREFGHIEFSSNKDEMKQNALFLTSLSHLFDFAYFKPLVVNAAS